MSAALFGAAAVIFAGAAVAYYHGHFVLAGVAGLIYAGVIGAVVVRSVGTAAAVVVLALLAVAPGIFVIVHAYDAKRGHLLLPTVYSIPIAFVAGALLWLVAGVGLAF